MVNRLLCRMDISASPVFCKFLWYHWSQWLWQQFVPQIHLDLSQRFRVWQLQLGWCEIRLQAFMLHGEINGGLPLPGQMNNRTRNSYYQPDFLSTGTTWRITTRSQLLNSTAQTSHKMDLEPEILPEQ